MDPLRGKGTHINPLIWCAVGAVVGLAVGTMMGSDGKVLRIEDMLVGVFGAFIGGEFMPSVLAEKVVVPATAVGATATEAAASTGFSGAALLGGIAGAVVLLLLLRLMRRAVGPMRGRKSRAGNNR